MRLTDYTDFTLRVLIFLGTHRERLVRTDEIATAYGISSTHLAKVVNALARDGTILAKRGRGGGLQLAKDPSEISIGALVASSEPTSGLVECLGEDNTCPIAPACGLAGMLVQAEQAFLDVLNGFTLADVLAGRRAARLRKHFLEE